MPPRHLRPFGTVMGRPRSARWRPVVSLINDIRRSGEYTLCSPFLVAPPSLPAIRHAVHGPRTIRFQGGQHRRSMRPPAVEATAVVEHSEHTTVTARA